MFQKTEASPGEEEQAAMRPARPGDKVRL